MITMERAGARHVEVPSRKDLSVRRVPQRRPVTRDRRGPARPASVRVRGGAMCPSPVVPPQPAEHVAGLLRRVTAGVGLVVASAAAVFGLGLLADVASASSAPAGAPVSSVAHP
ncbi:hypothetical protein EV378_1061 [Pseudonocardia endophytica]|uniref:Uncharacterized protein n=1 Tax=Pseudonocardia endophytica TaxID=401976 RepID=A0A4R1HSV1_PSEEN|nr:hypothetical protein EV378_1061 [Pseudonocardia endophytica]